MTDTGLSVRQTPSIGFRLWLIYVMVASLWSAYRYYQFIDDQIRHGDPDWKGFITFGIPALLVLSLVSAAGAIALFVGRRVGFYLVVAVNAAALVIALLLGLPLTALIPGLIGLGVLWYLYSQNSDRLR